MRLIQATFPNIDGAISDYVEGALESAIDDLEDVEDVYEAVGEVLQAIDQNNKEDYIKEFCSKLLKIMKPNRVEKGCPSVSGNQKQALAEMCKPKLIPSKEDVKSNKSNEQSKQEDIVVSTQKQRDTKSKRRDKKAGTSNNKYFFFYIYSEHTK